MTMFTVGELKDPKMAQQIIAGLKARGIEAFSLYDNASEFYTIMLHTEESLEEARDFYRVKLGFAKAPQIDQDWVKIKTLPRGETTFSLVIICIVIYLLGLLNFGDALFNLLFIGKVESSFLYEVARGQIWRLITPIFVHLSFLHILFNMLWLKDLGSIIEFHFGRSKLLIFILVSGLFSNLLQYFVSGPTFGGMSGVLYAMVGFLWVYKKLNPSFEHPLPKFDIGMMIGWFVLCLTGALGPIANSAHGGGLVIGILWAVIIHFKETPDHRAHFKFLFLSFFFLIFTLLIEGYKLGGRYFFLLWQN